MVRIRSALRTRYRSVVGPRSGRRASIVVGAVMLFTPLLGATPSFAGSSGPGVAVVQGVVDCSDLLSAAGFAGSPSRLTLSAGSLTRTLQYPARFTATGTNAIFGQPQYESYRFAVPYRKGVKNQTVRWSLSCQDKDGNPAGIQRGQFSLASHFSPTHPATRNICNHGGTVGIVITVCNPALAAQLGNCAWEIVTGLVGSQVLDAVSTALDPPRTALDVAKEALTRVTGPLGGLILACTTKVKISTSTTTTTTPSSGGTGAAWPTGRNDGSIAFYAYLGASFLAPDWTSCDPSYCLAESDGTVYVFDNHLNQLGTVSATVANAATALQGLGIPSSDVQKLLAPTP